MPEPKHDCGGECPWHKKSRGCAHCYEGEPEVAFTHFRLCKHCVKAWFPNKSYAELTDFIEDQLDLAVLLASDSYKERMKRKDVEDLAIWLGIPPKEGCVPEMKGVAF